MAAQPPDLFDEAEIRELHDTDRRAATRIVALISYIFLFGVGLYVVIAYFAAP